MRGGVDGLPPDPENQLHELRAWVASSGHVIRGEYVDYESGQKGTEKRKQFAALFNDAAKRRCCPMIWFRCCGTINSRLGGRRERVACPINKVYWCRLFARARTVDERQSAEHRGVKRKRAPGAALGDVAKGRARSVCARDRATETMH